MNFTSVCVFCGSSSGFDPIYQQTATEFGRLLAQRSMHLVYGGGRVGLMGAVADAVLATGGTVTGVIPHSLMNREVEHRGIQDLRVTNTMHERKALMAELAGAFVALPGGFGTMDELCEILTWAQLGLHRKPCGLLNVAGFFDPLLTFFEQAVLRGFLKAEHLGALVIDTEAGRLLDRMAEHSPLSGEKWIRKADL